MGRQVQRGRFYRCGSMSGTRLGKSPFGHSGEKAIATYFSEGNGLALKKTLALNDDQWKDLTHFEGNANAFRLLTHKSEGRREGDLS